MLTINKEILKKITPIIDIHHAHTWLEISRAAILHNLAQYKRVLGDKLLAPVIKANAYGHGFQQIAAICEESLDVDWLCITLLSDALALRQQGVTKPILLLGPIDGDLSAAVHQNIEFIAYNKNIIEELNALGEKHKYVFGIHIKIDTGLSRIGIPAENALTLINYCKTLPNIRISGISTHLAEAQAQDQTFTLQQINQFNLLLTKLKEQNISIPLVHIANTAATTIAPLDNCNFFRVGVGMYGLWPSEHIKKETQNKYPWFTLQPGMTWKSRIMEVKQVPAYSFVGYNRTRQVTRDSTIAIIPVGYFDGYDLRFSNKASVRIHNTYAPIIGRVCMNHTIVDVTDIPNVHIGDEVILLGNYPEVSAYYFATLTGNNNVREILTKIFPHIPRVIVE